MKVNNIGIFLVYLSITLAVISTFLIFEDEIGNFAYSGEKFLTGDFYRIMTFQFFHKNSSHLIENFFALTIATLLAYEVSLRKNSFIAAFLLSSILIALIGGIVSPFTVIVGSSVGIYGMLGSAIMKGRTFIPYYIVTPIFIFTCFLEYFAGSSDGGGNYLFIQSLFHVGGLISGIAIFTITDILSKKQKIKILTESSGD
jgi:membrane associated rhomboid family serine protease